MPKLFVWDFHGVLEKGNEHAVLEISNEVLKQEGYRERFSIEHCRKLYGLKWFEYFEWLLPGKKHEHYLDLQEKCLAFEKFNPGIVDKYLEANDYAKFVLEEIAKEHKQILISTTQSDASLTRFLEKAGLNAYFPDKTAMVLQMALKCRKTGILKDYLNDKKFDKLIIVGDSPKDMELKSVAGGTTYLYAHPGIEFRECKSDYKIRDLREILKEL